MKLNGKLQKMAEDNKKLRETIDTQLREIQSFKQVAMSKLHGMQIENFRCKKSKAML